MTELLSAPARTATGWFLALCGPLETATDADGHITARADYLQPPDLPAQALEALALEALHQISCRLAALARERSAAYRPGWWSSGPSTRSTPSMSASPAHPPSRACSGPGC